MGHKSNLSKLKKIEIVSSIFSDHNATELNINCKKKTVRNTNTYIKGEIDSNTVIVGDFNTPITPMDKSSKQKINKETQS